MNARAAVLLAAALAAPALVRAAAPAPVPVASVALSTGGPAQLDRAMDDRAARLGAKVGKADAPFAELVKRKVPLVRVAFADLGAIERSPNGTTFVGRHLSAAGADFALVSFPTDVDVSTRAAAVVIGSFEGSREIKTAGGATVRVPVIAAGVIGVIDDGSVVGGRLAFTPDSDIRVYELLPKLKTPKKPSKGKAAK